MWLEGYEAARKVMRHFFQELHQGQEPQGVAGRAWKQFAREMLEKEGIKDKPARSPDEEVDRC
eukprot:3988749-Heterocapsa_arctica.AAC.1